MSDSDMLDYFDTLDKQSKALKEEILKLCWYMRGSLSYDEGMSLSQEDRSLMSKLIKDNLETTKKSGMPFF